MKKIITFLLIVSMTSVFCGCNETTEQVSSSQSVAETSVVQEQSTTEGSSTENTGEDDIVYEVNINSDRALKDGDEEKLKDIISGLFDNYYNGIKAEDYSLCFSVFPEFYQKATEDETKELGQTNDQYIKEINAYFNETYGDDYYAFITIGNIVQLNDEVLESIKDGINKAFNVSISLEDAYSVYIDQTARGSLKKETQNYQYIMLKIDGQYYLYDDYFES